MATRFAIFSRGCRCIRANDGQSPPEKYDPFAFDPERPTYPTVEAARWALLGKSPDYSMDDGHGYGAGVAYQIAEGHPWRWCWKLDPMQECPT